MSMRTDVPMYRYTMHIDHGTQFRSYVRMQYRPDVIHLLMHQKETNKNKNKTRRVEEESSSAAMNDLRIFYYLIQMLPH